MRDSLKWCVLSVVPVVILSLIPQAVLWTNRGAEWQGAYAIVDGDEFLYSAYINALIDGRPRRNDPFSGRDDNPNAPLPESAFSIQLLPPFVVSSVGKIFHLSASTCFIILSAFSALCAAVTIYWVLTLQVHDDRLAAVATLVVLLFGTAAAGQGLLGALFSQNVSTLGLAFLRRYQPAAAFFLFFAFCGLVDCAVRSRAAVRRLTLATLSGVALVLLVFSYLYLWTAAVVWVVTFGALWICFVPGNRRQTFEVMGIVAGLLGLALPLYVHLLSNRAHALDAAQTLISTHRPDFFRVPEILGVLLILSALMLMRRRRIQLRQPSTIFALSFGILPIVLFNQQVISGRSMQPFHFQHYVVNYAVLVGVVIILTNLVRILSLRPLVLVTFVILLWGIAEVAAPTQIRSAADVKNDQIVPVLLRLKNLSRTDGTLSDLRNQGKTSNLVFSPDIDVLMLVPTWTAHGTMIGIGGLDFGSATLHDRKVFAYLYYSGADTARLSELLEDRGDDLSLNYYVRSALFGHERVLSQLSLHHRGVQDSEIQEQLRAYEVYVSTFSQAEAAKHPFVYVILPVGTDFDFSRIDRWYEREPGERVGQFELYRVKRRS